MHPRLLAPARMHEHHVMHEDATGYRPRGVVAGALATLVHLKHSVVAMRSLAACWADDAVNTPTAT